MAGGVAPGTHPQAVVLGRAVAEKAAATTATATSMSAKVHAATAAACYQIMLVRILCLPSPLAGIFSFLPAPLARRVRVTCHF